MNKQLLLPAFTALLFACSADTKDHKGGVVSTHYNLEKLATDQTYILGKINPSVEKTVIVNGKTEKSTLKVSNWENELGVIKKSNIDKPAFIGEYSLKNTMDSSGNSVKTFTPLKDNLSVKFQQIQFDKVGQPKRLSSASEDKNFLYFSKKEIVADFENKNGKATLKTYAVTIVQKIICLDTFKMKVEATIINQ